MAAAKDRLVVRSMETDEGRRCVDIFRRPDGSFGFEEYIREPEDNKGWQPAGSTGALRYASEEQALAAARQYARWLA